MITTLGDIMRRAALLVLTLLVAGCGGGAAGGGEASSTATPSANSISQPSATTAPATTTSAPDTMSPEAEASFVAALTGQTFMQNSEALSDELVKSSSLVEAQIDFRFDEPGRSLILAVTSVFGTGGSTVPYVLATNFAPVFWGTQATSSVRPESLVAFSVAVDDTTYLCSGPVMASLADRELSEAMFVEQCAT